VPFKGIRHAIKPPPTTLKSSLVGYWSNFKKLPGKQKSKVIAAIIKEAFPSGLFKQQQASMMNMMMAEMLLEIKTLHKST